MIYINKQVRGAVGQKRDNKPAPAPAPKKEKKAPKKAK